MTGRITQSRWTLRFAIVTLVLTLTGCAVLTVDVDMYKGSLANDETVIGEQIKSEIIGAKSLLLTLRNKLENPDNMEKANKSGKPTEEFFRKRYEYMPMPDDPTEREIKWLKNPEAVRVNAILGLYKDSAAGIEDKIVLSYLDQLKANYERIQKVRIVISPDRKYDEQYWSDYEKCIYITDTKDINNHSVIKKLDDNITCLNNRVSSHETIKNDAKKKNDELEKKNKQLERSKTGQSEEKIEEIRRKIQGNATTISQNRKVIQERGRKIGEFNDIKGKAEGLRKKLVGYIADMQDGYRDLLYPDYSNKPYRYIYTLSQAHNNIRDKVQEAQREMNEVMMNGAQYIHTTVDALKPIIGKPAPVSTNEKFEWLQDEGLVGTHFNFIFDGQKLEKNKVSRVNFIHRVNSIGQTFIERRSIIDQSFRLVLELIEYINTPGNEYITSGPLFNRQLIELALSMIRGEYVFAAIHNEYASPETLALKNALFENLSEEIKQTARWNNGMTRPYKKALNDIFEADPYTISRLLKKTHLFLITEPYKPDKIISDTESRKKSNFALRLVRRFGISRIDVVGEGKDDSIEVPDSERDPFKAYQEGSVQIQKLRSGAGLDRGRLPEGLETLIDNYLKMVRDFPVNPSKEQQEELDKRRAVLIDALVRFSRKLLVIANFDTLLKNGNGSADNGTKKYTQVLQAVGNSITVLANELSRRAAHDKKLVADRHREIRAQQMTLSSGGGKAFKTILDELKNNLNSTTEEYNDITKKIEKDEKEHKKAQKHFDDADTKLNEAKANLAENTGPSEVLKNNFTKYKNAYAVVGDGGMLFAKLNELVSRSILSKDFYDRLVGVLKEERAKAITGSGSEVSSRAKQLDDAVEVVDIDLRGVVSADTTVGKEGILRALRVKIAAEYITYEKQYVTAKEPRDKAEKAKEQAQNEYERVQKDLDDLVVSVEKSRQEKAQFQTKINALESAVDHINEQGAVILSSLDQDSHRQTHVSVKSAIMGYLYAEIAHETNEQKEGDLKATVAIIQGLQDPVDIPNDLSRDSKDSKKVLDDMIAVLRYDYAQNVRMFGKESQQARQSADALEVLYKQRANMVYIRQASAYLSSSYPASSVQKSQSSVAWQNMLGRHAMRSVPFIGECLTNSESKDELETLQEIDKQSWQNVNHVRVAGMGDTNYVVVKDDIGNWYIKSYSGDPKLIIQGAQNMALFAASAGAGRNLIKLNRDRQEAIKKGQSPSESIPQSPRMRQLQQYDGDYMRQQLADYDQLKAALEDDGLQNSILSQWQEHPDTTDFKTSLEGRLKTYWNKFKKTRKEVFSQKDATVADRYMRILKGLILFHNDIKLDLETAPLVPNDEKDIQSRKTARTLMSKSLQDFMEQYITLREKASSKHENTLMVIGDSMN